MPNEGIEEIIADTYEGLGFHARAAMVRENLDPHNGCADIHQFNGIAAILNDVPDAATRLKHDEKCWHVHTACLRDKLFNHLGWE